MALSWATKRRLIYLSIVLGVFLVLVSFPVISFITRSTTCFDGRQNQGEVGVDCGGPCLRLCLSQVTDLITLWSRALPAREGVYDAVALVENPNFGGGVREISYSFKLYDKNNLLIVEREGETFINPNEQLAVFEGGIMTGERVPARAFFEFTEVPQWLKVLRNKPDILVKNKKLEGIATRPKLKATLVNQTLSNVEDIIVVALLFDRDDNLIAVSKTEVDVLRKDSSKDITFIWRQTFKGTPLRIDVIPRTNIVTTD